MHLRALSRRRITPAAISSRLKIRAIHGRSRWILDQAAAPSLSARGEMKAREEAEAPYLQINWSY